MWVIKVAISFMIQSSFTPYAYGSLYSVRKKSPSTVKHLGKNIEEYYLCQISNSLLLFFVFQITVGDIYFYNTMEFLTNALPKDEILGDYPALKNVYEKVGEKLKK